MAQKNSDVHELLSGYDFIDILMPKLMDQFKIVIDATVSASVLKVCKEIAVLNADLAALTAKVEIGLQQLIRNPELYQSNIEEVDLKALKDKLHLEISVEQFNRLQRGFVSYSGLNNQHVRKRKQVDENEHFPKDSGITINQAMAAYRRRITQKDGLDWVWSSFYDIKYNDNEAPPERPTSGPAARVEIPDTDQLPLVTVPGRQPSPTVPNPVSNNSTPVRACTGASSHQSASYEASNEPTRNIDVCLEMRLNYSDLRTATNNFDEEFIIGKGAWGSVYRGLLKISHRQDALKVAIKRLHLEGSPGDPASQFRTEIEKLSQLSHPNLLPLVGYSDDGPVPCLVYTFMENGSLMDRLVSQEALHWKTRMNIAMESAEGILYLHTVLPKPLVHRDVKSANILLDGEMRPKLGDFGLVRLGASGERSNTSVNTSTAVGTSAYMAPEAFHGDISVKLDVFSFGVVLLELLTGLPPFDEEREDRDIVSYLLDEERSIADHLDQRAGNWDSSIAKELSELAINCLEYKKNKRPNMTLVLQNLQEISNRIPL